MKECLDKIVNEFIDKRTLEGLATSILGCGKELGISDKTVYNRFKSMYGMNPRNYVLSKIYPTHEDICKLILSTETCAEFKEKINLPHTVYVGIYDREFGVSTFKKARLIILKERMVVDYNPVREDNRSLWYSQLLGDGSYCARRHAFRIIHGHKQAEYLKWKVALINKAYPKTPSKVTRHIHSQGHTYYSYYSGNIGNIDIPHTSRKDVINKMTPLGWLIWLLDDGGYYQNVTIFSTDKDICDAAIVELKTYGILARHCQNGICMCGKEQDLKFYKNFIEPFINNIPKSMLYKVEDIVGNI